MTEYQEKDDLPNLYKILGLNINVCKDPDCDNIIKKAYIKKVKLCHPDKHPERKDLAEIFELLTRAYNVLRDEKSRETYNHKLALNKQCSGDFLKLKKEAKDYNESMGEYLPPTDQQKLAFAEQMKAMDAKHGYNSDLLAPILERDAKKQLTNLNRVRNQQDIELMPKMIFEKNQPLDMAKFNAIFDKVHNRDKDDAIVAHNGVPSAWNDAGVSANFSNFDSLDNLYVDNGNRFDTSKQNYGGVDFGQSVPSLSKEEVADIKPAEYFMSHNQLENDYYKKIKNALRDREESSGVFNNRVYGDFKRDDTAGYGIFDQLGFKIDDKLALDVEDDDIAKRYERLMTERQKLIPPGSQTKNLPQGNR